MGVASNSLPIEEGGVVVPQISFIVDEPTTCDALTKKATYFMQMEQVSDEMNDEYSFKSRSVKLFKRKSFLQGTLTSTNVKKK